MALTTNVPRPNLQKTSYLRNGMSSDIGGVQFPLQSGVPIQNLYMFKVIPASLSASCISSTNVWIAGGQPLNQVNTGSGTDIISTALNLRNLTGFGITNRDVSGILLDCERCIALNFAVFTAYDTTVTVTGYDYRGNPMTIQEDIEAGSTQYIVTNPISIVTSVVLSDDPGVSFQVGNSNNIGLPYYLSNKQFVMSCSWGGTAITTTSSQIVASYNWRVTNTTSATTPTRGYVRTTTDTDGTSLLTCCYYVYGGDSELDAELNNANQSSLKIASIQTSTGPKAQNVVPLLTKYDLTGVVYPGDNDFIYAYNQAKLF